MREALERVRVTLRFLANQMSTVHGFYYHFVDMDNGLQWEKCELSSIDTSLLLCGILTAHMYFKDAEIQDLTTKIYNRVEWPWTLNDGPTFSMGWMLESGFLKARGEHYCELMMIYLLGIGSPTHPMPARLPDALHRRFRHAGLGCDLPDTPMRTVFWLCLQRLAN